MTPISELLYLILTVANQDFFILEIEWQYLWWAVNLMQLKEEVINP